MSNKEEMIEIEGTVTQAFPNAFFEVELTNGHKALCHIDRKSVV